MKKNDVILAVSCIMYSYLFYTQSAGINFIIFSTGLITCLITRDHNLYRKKEWLIAATGAVVSSVMISLYGNLLSVIAGILSLALLSALSIHKKSSVILGMFYTAYSIAGSYVFIILDSIERRSMSKSATRGRTWIKIIVPFLIISVFLIFFGLYRESNPLFHNLTKNINLDFITWGWAGFTILGIFIMYGFYNNKAIPAFYNIESDACESLEKTVQITNIRNIEIENITGSVLLILLNLLLVTVNILDITYLWGNNRLPEGITYSESVHQGTGTLVLSVIIAISIILIIFRSHMNFFKKNKILKAMTYVWIIQNIFMVVSTAYRNELYIAEYTLTYKRIGVFFYLLLTAIGLIVTFLKICATKSNWFLYRKTSWAFFTVLILSSLFNWDLLITNYNIRHSKTIDRYYLTGLSYINIPALMELKPVEEKFVPRAAEWDNSTDVSRNFEYGPYYSNADFQYKIHGKIFNFLKDYEEVDWQSWCYGKQIVKEKIASYEKAGKLAELFLQNQKIESLSPVKKFTNTEILNLNNNRLKNLDDLRFFNKLTDLKLGYNNLQDIKHFPAVLSLKKLDLSNNAINDFTPLRKSLNIEFLDISRNHLASLDKIPDMPELKALVLSWNNINSLEPLAKFKKLESLDLSNVTTKSIGSLPVIKSLRQLDLSMTGCNSNTREMAEKLRGFDNLENLNMSSCNLVQLTFMEDIIYDAKTNKLVSKNEPLLKNLKSLNISNNGLNDLWAVQFYTTLEELNITSNNITDIDLLNRLINLKVLNAAGNKFKSLSVLNNLTNLKILDLSNNDIRDVPDLKNLQSIEILYLNNNLITDIKEIVNLNSLKHLYLNQNSISGLTGIQKLKNLETLCITNNNIRDYSPLFAMKHLKELSISNADKAVCDKLQKELPGTKISYFNMYRN